MRHFPICYRTTGRGFSILRTGGVAVVGTSTTRIISALPRISTFCVSPTHQKRSGGQIFTLRSYRPGLPKLLPTLLGHSPRIVTGLSPVTSVRVALRLLPKAASIRILSIEGRYGRLLFIIRQRTSNERPLIQYVGFKLSKVRSFSFALRRRHDTMLIPTNRMNACLCRPGTSILGTNTFGRVTIQAKIGGLRIGDRLCASSRLISSFPNHEFQISRILSFAKGLYGKLSGAVPRTGVAIHGFPLSMRRLHGQAGVASKNRICLFTAALISKRGILIGYSGT